MHSLTYFFRCPHSIYFSVEKIFHQISKELRAHSPERLSVKEVDVPYTSKPSTLRANIRFVKSNQSAINHITGDIHYAILGCSKRNVNILTVHDCVLLYRYPKTSLRHWMIRWLWYQWPLRKADAITVISENTKRDLLKFTNCPEEKIHIVPNFIDPSFQSRPKIFSAKATKLLFIGTAPNKNLERTIEALSGLDVELIIVGYLTEAQKQELESRHIRFHIMNKLSDQEMRDVYAEADIMLFPSTYEGFGLPIIEAQATGRPVITSDLEPMKGVAGEGACLVNPYQPASIREGMIRVIENESYRNMLVEKGFENVKRFQISSVAAQYRDLYLELIKKKGL